MTMTIAQIYRYPVKGLTPEALERVALSPGEGLPHDRRFALAHGATQFDPAAPEWMPKTNFLMLMRNERLARLRTRFDEASGVLAIERDGKTVVRANISELAGRTVVEQFFAAFMAAEARGAPRLVEAPGHMFSDTPRKAVSVIGLASIRDLERVVRGPVDPRRFRANFYFDGGQPWQEFGFIGKEFSIGPVRLRALDRIDRCAATNVDPETAARDLNIPRALQTGFRHVDTGIYAEIVTGGTVGVGDPLTVA
ncbi:MAG: MOSC domain-containing protein [Rhodospirillales bacterium]|nr:MOSC domain-containing protein [Rhodospirillales bacterium]